MPRLLFFLILLLPITLLAQSEKIYFKEYGIKEGLPEEWVSSINQDEQGFIWFTTQNGLVRYDGYEFEVFGINHQEAAEGSLQLASTNGGVIKGHKGDYWIGGNSFGGASGLAMYDAKTHHFKNWLYEKEDSALVEFSSFSPLFEDTRDNVWFLNYASDSLRLGRLHVASDSFFYYPVDQNAREFYYHNDRIGNYHLYESPGSQKLWFIGHEPGVLYKWDPVVDTFEIVLKPGDSSLLPTDTLETLFPMQNDRVILLSDHSMYIWNSDTEVIEQSYHSGLSDEISLLDATNYTAFQDYYGKIWVTHLREGLSVINPETRTVEHFLYGEGKLFGEHWPQAGQSSFPRTMDSSGIWFRNQPSNTHLYYNHLNQDFTFFDQSFNTRSKPMPGNTLAYRFLKDHSGLLWLGFQLNLFKEDPSGKNYDFFPKADSLKTGLPSPQIHSFLEDQSGQFWVGTAVGLRVFDSRSKRFDLPKSLNILKDKNINGLLEDSHGQIWIGTMGSGVYRYSPNSNTLKHMYKKGDAIVQMLQDESGAIWLSTYKERVERILKIDQRDGIILGEYTFEDTGYYKFYSDRQGNIWINGYGEDKAGLYKIPKDSSEIIPYIFDPNDPASISDNNLLFLREDGQGRIWIGTENGGLCQYKPGADNFTRYESDSGLKSGVTTFAEDSLGQIWLGAYSGGGLGLLDTSQNKLIMFGEKEGLLHHDIDHGHFDNGSMLYYRDRLWIPSPRGLSIFNTRTRSFDNYTDIKFEPNPWPWHHQYYQTSDHSMWIASTEGLYRIYPDEILKKDSISPKVWITSMTINGEPYEAADGDIFQETVSRTTSITLPYWQNDLSFEFVALHYLDPVKNQYSWKMEGIDDSWTMPSTDRKVRYADLSPGTYTFHVKGSNADGIWNDIGARMEITILPPWWRSNLAYIVYFLVLVGVIWAFVRWRLYYFRLHYEKETAIAKASAAEEANEAKSVFLSTVSHELRTPLTSIIGFTKLNHKNLLERVIPNVDPEKDKAQKSVNRIAKNQEIIQLESERLLSLINELLDLAKIESGKMEWKMEEIKSAEIIERATTATSAIFKQKPDLELIIDAPEDLPMITADENRLIQVLINLLSNAVKFTDKGHVRIGAKEKQGSGENEITFFIQDTGSGIPPEHLDQVFEKFKQVEANQVNTHKGTGLGLPICKEIVEHHEGKIWVESELGKGSTFAFSIPISRG